MALKTWNIVRANAEIAAAQDLLTPHLEKAGIKSILIDGKTVSPADATLAAQIDAIFTANPPGTNSAQVSDVIVSNDLISKEIDRVNTALALSDTSVATLTRDNAKLQGELTAALSSVQTLTAEKADTNNRLQAAINQYSESAKVIAGYNSELSRVCIAAGCIELVDESGKVITEDAPAEVKQAAADKFSVADKLTAYRGAVNSALSKTGVDVTKLPGGSGNHISIASRNILNEHNAITNASERTTHYLKNREAIDAAYRSLHNQP